MQLKLNDAHSQSFMYTFVFLHDIPLRPKLTMMSASPSMMRVNDSGVTSLHTLKALKKASFMTSSSRSGVYPRILQGKRKVSF